MEMLNKIKNKIVEAKDKTVKFYSDHKDQIKKGAIVVGSFALGYVICKVTGKSTLKKELDQLEWKSLDDSESKNYLPEENVIRKIDEDVFTELAPAIEDAILDDSSDEDLIERYYDVDFPKHGDYKNGTWKGRKYVKVLVQDAWTPELDKDSE